MVGYRITVDGEVLNVLRWTTRRGDARETHPAGEDPVRCRRFGGQRPPVDHPRRVRQRSGFTGAHLDGVRFRGWRMASTLVTEVAGLTAPGEPFVYAYYDGVDKVSHEYGLGAHYDAELAAADRLVADVLSARAPPAPPCVVTADHGQVHVGSDVTPLAPEVAAHVELPVRRGPLPLAPRPARAAPAPCSTAAAGAHGDRAWVRTRDELIDEGWFGPMVTDAARAALRRRRPRRQGHGRLHRADRHRPLPPRRPPRLRHPRRARRPVAGRHRVDASAGQPRAAG